LPSVIELGESLSKDVIDVSSSEVDSPYDPSILELGSSDFPHLVQSSARGASSDSGTVVIGSMRAWCVQMKNGWMLVLHTSVFQLKTRPGPHLDVMAQVELHVISLSEK
jgi:hypothetical protein